MLNDSDSIHQTDEGLREYLRSRENRSLYRYRLTLESPQAPRVTVSGRE